ncbi:DUF4192 domain-containing protein [Nonomuraea sp. NPDC050404]|uniref:DUF4192 domain-containing protein n=1 Tax=Nonomuraea sp. NPDC050404 TaxID=3155783 RepID=UPI0033DBC835
MTAASELANTVTIKNLADLVSTVPYLLGFHPTESLVAVGIHDAKAKAVVRLDLTQDPAEMAERTGHLTNVLVRNGIHQALLIGYGPGSQVTPMMDAATEALPQGGVNISDAIRVDDGRYWSYICTDASCCPPEGAPVGLTNSVPAVAAVVAGMRALPDKAALAATLDPPQNFDQARALSITREVCARAKRTSGECDDWFGDGVKRVIAALDRAQAREDLDAETAAWLGVCLTAKPVRDMAMTYIQRYGAETHLRLWTEVTRKVQPAFVAAPATLLAFAAMCRGDGTLAGIALDLALSASSHYTLALLFVEALMVGLPPSEVLGRDWSQMADDIAARVQEQPSAAWPLLPEGW